MNMTCTLQKKEMEAYVQVANLSAGVQAHEQHLHTCFWLQDFGSLLYHESMHTCLCVPADTN